MDTIYFKISCLQLHFFVYFAVLFASNNNITCSRKEGSNGDYICYLNTSEVLHDTREGTQVNDTLYVNVSSGHFVQSEDVQTDDTTAKDQAGDVWTILLA